MNGWHTSSCGQASGGCVEVRTTLETTELRDTRNRERGGPVFAAPEWRASIAAVQTAEAGP